MSLDGMKLLQRIIQSPPPPRSFVVALSALNEGLEECKTRYAHAETLDATDVIHTLELNTYEEARSVKKIADIAGERLTDLTIVTSAYHQLRAFLTFLKVFQGTNVRLWNAPALSPWDKLEGELQKIAEYQRKGHCATYLEGLEHLDWRDSYNCAGAA